ncbi:MAG TPA: hypothetical protein VN785_12325 [Candidatus Angelobacter sp.]|nr:hypothetical protein [Candidatus Angelobacter sp.]
MKKLMIVLVFLAAANTCLAQKNPPLTVLQHGMWLCNTEVTANGFSSDILGVKRSGVVLTYKIVNDIAKNQIENSGKSGCYWVASDGLKPVNYDPYWSEFIVEADGKERGWVLIWEYVDYMRFHQVVSK